jgi:CheY-like chemotaxis protein
MAAKGRVLLMDDEDSILDVTKEVLTFLGYEVALAKEGGEAISLYREAMAGGAPFDVVILDLTVPAGIGGEEAIQT